MARKKKQRIAELEARVYQLERELATEHHRVRALSTDLRSSDAVASGLGAELDGAHADHARTLSATRIWKQVEDRDAYRLASYEEIADRTGVPEQVLRDVFLARGVPIDTALTVDRMTIALENERALRDYVRTDGVLLDVFG